MRMTPWRRRSVVLVGAFVLSVLVIGPAPSARAQPGCYPDGCPPPTNPPPKDDVRCELDRRKGPPGTRVTATVIDGGGRVSVRLFFSGDQVAAAVAPPPGDVRLTFVVPDAGRGNHDVVAVGDDYSVACRFGGARGFLVTDGGGRGGGGRGGGGQDAAEVRGDRTTREMGGEHVGGDGASASGQVEAPNGDGLLPFDLVLVVLAGFSLAGVGSALWWAMRRRRVSSGAP